MSLTVAFWKPSVARRVVLVGVVVATAGVASVMGQYQHYAVPGRGRELLLAAIADDPHRVGEWVYQRHAKPWFLAEKPEKFTFLANAGVVAILWFSGSLIVVLGGMALVTAILMVTEQLGPRGSGSRGERAR